MSKAEEIKARFEARLEDKKQARQTRLEADLQSLNAKLLGDFRASLPADLESRASSLLSGWQSPSTTIPSFQPQVDISASSQLKQLDDTFIRIFKLGDWYPLSRMEYLTVYCESLQEFFTPMVEQMDLSPEGRRASLAGMSRQAEETARTRGGGILGYNLPGIGAYINGWLFAYGRDITPRQAFDQPELLRHIFKTAAHEKLGHGFLAVYSTLGQVKTSLGLTQIELARKFGLQTVDDPTSSLRQQQDALLFMASQLLEEGWATWVENLLVQSQAKNAPRSRYTLKVVMDAIRAIPEDLPPRLPPRNDLLRMLLTAIVLLLGEEPASLDILHQAVLVLDEYGGRLDDYFGDRLGQPLRYAAGELLFSQAEKNLGALCVPYAALIAANLNFDPAAIGPSDLHNLLAGNPRMNPDTRMAGISRLVLTEKNSVPELARLAASHLSLSIPQELKVRGGL